MMTPMTLPAQNVLITGAAKRIGAFLARHLAAKGWSVAIHCNGAKAQAEALKAELTEKGSKAIVLQRDFSDAAGVESLIGEAERGLGPLSLLLHNASLFERDTLESMNPGSWQKHQQINLLSPLLLSRSFAAKVQKEDRKAQIICLLDGMRGWSISPAFFSYSMSRMGMENFITLMAGQFAPHVRLNGVLLGPSLPGHMDKPDTFDKLAKLVPLERVSSPEEVCDAVEYLLRAEGMTGQMLDLTGGMNILRPPHRLVP